MAGSLSSAPYNTMTGTSDESPWSNGSLDYFYGLHFQQTPLPPFSRVEPAPGSGGYLSHNDTQQQHALFNNNFFVPFDAFPLDSSWMNENLPYSSTKPSIIIPRETSYGAAFSASSGLIPIAQNSSLAKLPESSQADGEMLASDTRKRKQARRASSKTYQCHWKRCTYQGMFSCKGVLMRHIETQHVTPRSFNCPTCGKSFGRKDNMSEHLARVHLQRIEPTA